MSSHHVIREGQEPAIYLRNSNSIILKVLHNLLEWSPYLIVNSETISFCNAHGIKPDAIVNETTDDIDFFIEKIPYINNSTDLDRIQDWLKNKNCDQLLIFDDINELKSLISGDPLFGVIDRDIKYSMIRDNIAKWFPEGQRLTLIKSEPEQKIEYIGLKKTNQAFLVETKGLIKLSSNNFFYLGEHLE
ncbi:hypothetical protein [Mangrovivirga cuniculi]|uniref:Thiamine pyrophosphokinase n=1 Tax=Mangrovivirga cuniculi TaxID=2715131 RepID=A0A4D7JXP0_9BACT|nr:hypothetical protein [Mangrovivirga cuniculi]QCK13474.1 hypothetical protein DCC35_01250 [Mangrovivirga cuniculi]